MATEYLSAAISRHIWDTKYRHRENGTPLDADITDTWRRVARALAEAEASDRDTWEETFYGVLERFRFVPGGRIQAGAGTRHRVTLFNCFVMGLIEDSMDGIFNALKEAALTLQQGGGVGFDFSTLRPRGAVARGTGSIASGPVSFMNIWDAMCATLLSTGARRGAMMATLRCDHPDIEEFVTAKRDPHKLRHFNLSVLASDAFMNAIREDREWPLVFPEAGLGGMSDKTVPRAWSGSDGAVSCRVMKVVRARELWDRIMRSTYDFAEPGVIFIDRVNRMNNLRYRETISATNPCITGDTWIHTTDGPRQARELLGRPFTAVVEGRAHRSSDRGVFSTGRKMVYHLHTREGHSLRLTADHPLLRCSARTPWQTATEWVKAADLRPDDRIALNDHRGHAGWPGFGTEGEGYIFGVWLGGGTLAGGAVELIRVCPGLVAVNDDVTAPSGARLAGRLGIRPGNKTITDEVERCSSDFYRGLLRGLFDTAGSIQGTSATGVSVRLSRGDEGLLERVQRMLLRLGIASTILRFRRLAGPRPLPDGGRRPYHGRGDHELVISGGSLSIFAELIGFEDGRKKAGLQDALSSDRGRLNRERYIATVESLEPLDVEEVFDAEIPGINAFDANGLIVHNCGEIPLQPYGACDLGSINLTRFVRDPFGARASFDLEDVARVVKVAVRMLDNVIDVSRFPLKRQAEQARGTRRIGLGMTGLADALIMLGMKYGSRESLDFAASVMRTICHTAYRTSIELASEKGVFPFFDRERYLESEFIKTLPDDIRAGIAKCGIRNSHLTAIAPTGTISLLANNVSSSLEPVFNFSYRRRVLELDGTYTEYSLRDYAYLQWQQMHPGEKDDLPPQFVDARTLPPRVHIDMQAAVQPYVDNAISKTINIPEDFAFEAFREVYDYAYDHGLKGCTTFRPNAVTGAVLSTEGEGFEKASQCCDLEREAD